VSAFRVKNVKYGRGISERSSPMKVPHYSISIIVTGEDLICGALFQGWGSILWFIGHKRQKVLSNKLNTSGVTC